MTRRKISFLGLHALQVTLVTGCMMGLLAGCSSNLRTTIVSGGEGQKLQMAQVEPEPVVVETVAAQPIQEVIIPAVPVFDIAVEEPARAVIRPEPVREIFATSRTPDVSSEISSRLEPSPPPVPSTSEPAIQSPSIEIPAIAFEPELPARPTLPDDQTSPVQIAKVVPQQPEQMDISTKALEAALSDIYFDYDQFAIREDAGALLKANAQLLSEKFAESNIVIEGHCDERGTQSYNMVLGERRAKAVKHFLQDLGVPVENLQVVSYGKDKPFCTEQTEACWQGNRRGHFVIK